MAGDPGMDEEPVLVDQVQPVERGVDVEAELEVLVLPGMRLGETVEVLRVAPRRVQTFVKDYNFER